MHPSRSPISTCVAFDNSPCFRDAHILDVLHTFALNKKSGYERESAAVGLHSLASVVGVPSAPILLRSLPTLYDLYMDKGEVVRNASMEAVKTILKLFPPESTGLVFRTLEEVVEKGKWKAKVGALDGLRSFVKTAKENVANELGNTLPKVELALHDTKQEVFAIHALVSASSNLFSLRCLPQPQNVPQLFAQRLLTQI